ncbi:ATP-binding protein [Wenjunlia tyrosinilytica]|uniref:Histidine kinase/HSP90-like ATPase domain-containing protein n=1 Tax=Wenjunlia tyrosinilytica TaxID=1544741 RepID=A0A918DSN6_9ACTN|nr:ATP-binding protein [Wenjunlia tyrosinilytica]GGO81896.1 hypothetical protein GCM10012280_07250 [Wenjunlia tyrosinilytica]
MNPTPAPPQQHHLTLTAAPHAARHVRRLVRVYLVLWDMPELTDAVELAATELLANVFTHVPDGRCTVRLRRLDGGVRVEVHDSCAEMPVARRAGLMDESGRGLAMIAAITSAWGVEPDPGGGGKCVWFEVGA